jgi:hypothetical protein
MIYDVFSLEYLPNNQQNDCVSSESIMKIICQTLNQKIYKNSVYI